jgi:hypothetical protein
MVICLLETKLIIYSEFSIYFENLKQQAVIKHVVKDCINSKKTFWG